MKRSLAILAVSASLLAIPASHLIGGSKGHVPLGKMQSCHKGNVITVSENALGGHLTHGDCQLPVCDFNNIFHTGDSCSAISDTDSDGRCDAGLNPRAGATTPGCPAGRF